MPKRSTTSDGLSSSDIRDMSPDAMVTNVNKEGTVAPKGKKLFGRIRRPENGTRIWIYKQFLGTTPINSGNVSKFSADLEVARKNEEASKKPVMRYKYDFCFCVRLAFSI